MSLTSETATNATVLTVTALIVENYLEVVRPVMSNLSRTKRFIIGIWICALCSAVFQVMPLGIVNYEKEEPLADKCKVRGHGEQIFFALSSLAIFLVQMSLITVLFVVIFLKLHTSRVLNPVKKSLESRDRIIGTSRFKSGASQRRVTRMLVAVVVLYFLCLAPSHVRKLIAIRRKGLDQPTNTIYKVYPILTYLSNVLYFLFAAINPFLYYIMSNKFRNAFKVTITTWCRFRNGSRLERTYSAQMASQKERAEAKAKLKRSRNLRQQRRLIASSSQMCEMPPQSQSFKRSNLTVVNIESKSGRRKKQLAKGSDSLISLQSISNSSLRELDQEQNKEELAIYLHLVNCEIIEKTEIRLFKEKVLNKNFT